MRVLITGRVGFISSLLAEAPIARHDGVLTLDDLSTGSMENIRHLKVMPRLHYSSRPDSCRKVAGVFC